MKPRLFSLRLPVLIIALIFWTSCVAEAQSPPGAVAFTNVNVIPMDSDRVLDDQTVVVRNGRIEKLGNVAEIELPGDAVVVDGDGAYLLPGLAEMHGHIPQPESDPQYATDIMLLYVANGITTVRGMQGAQGQLELADRIADGELIGPTLYLAGPAFSGGSIDSPEQAEERVRQQKEEGWNLLKVLPGLTLDEYDAMARTANELNIPFAGHVPSDVGLIHAIEMGQETFDHIDGYLEYLDAFDSPIDSERLDEIIGRTREAGAWIVPTMAVWEVLLGALDTTVVEAYDELRFLPPNVRDQWIRSHRGRMANPDHDRARAQRIAATRIDVLRALNEAGVGILLGTDSPQQFSVPGFSTRREVERMVKAGMTPYEILRSGTFNIGRYFDAEDAFGVVAPGMRADLIMVQENPLLDVSNALDPIGVMTRGRWYTRAELDAKLEEIASRNRNQ